MRSQAFFAALVAVMAMCVAPTIAAPTSRGVALAERGQLYARETTTVCGVSIRLTANCAGRKNPVHLGKRALLERSGSDSEHSSSHESQDSKGNSQGSSFKPGSSQGASSDSENEFAKEETECDHAVELQLLKFSAESNGFCDAMKELAELTGVSLEKYLEDLKGMINQQTNFYPIPKSWNQQKNAATMKFRTGGGTSQAPLLPHDHDKQIIWGYLKQYVNSGPVKAMAPTLASKLDTEMHKIVTDAEAAAKKKQPAKAKEATDAAAKFKPAVHSMATVWTQYIAYIDRLAAST
jgi:hypothetical protein